MRGSEMVRSFEPRPSGNENMGEFMSQEIINNCCNNGSKTGLQFLYQETKSIDVRCMQRGDIKISGQGYSVQYNCNSQYYLDNH